MKKYYVLATYVTPKGRRTSLIGAMLVGKHDGLDDQASAYAELTKRVAEAAGGTDVIDPKQSEPFTAVTLKNGVDLFVQTAPDLSHWLKQVISYD